MIHALVSKPPDKDLHELWSLSLQSPLFIKIPKFTNFLLPGI